MNLIKLKLGIGALLVTGTTTAFVMQNQAQLKLRADKEAMQQQMVQLQTDKDALAERLATLSDSKKRLDDQLTELLKLRGEVGVLRKQVDDQKALQAENQQLQAQLSTVQPVAQAPQMSPEDMFTLQRLHTIDALKQVGLAMHVYAGNHQQLYPTNFDAIMGELSGITNFPGNIPLESFELVNQGKANDQYPQMIVARQRVPMQKPDGSWEREYCLEDGAVQTEASPDGNFATFEQQQQQQFGPPPSQ